LERRAVTEIPHLRMQRRLSEAMDAPIWPDGVYLQAFAESYAAEVHALLELAYRDGGGSVPAFGEWWRSLSQDSEYDPGLCFPVRDKEGNLAGFAQCWISAFVKDFVVHPRWRRHGIGRALLLHIFRIFKERRAQTVALKVETGNPSGAVAFYERLGMSREGDCDG
jgi:ribosomal protein S18 acetylase RimI-like enzyme